MTSLNRYNLSGRVVFDLGLNRSSTGAELGSVLVVT